MMTDLFQHKIKIPRNIPQTVHDDLLDWLIESVEHYNWDIKKIDNGHYICFAKLEDAVAFKTVWFPDDDENY